MARVSPRVLTLKSETSVDTGPDLQLRCDQPWGGKLMTIVVNFVGWPLARQNKTFVTNSAYLLSCMWHYLNTGRLFLKVVSLVRSYSYLHRPIRFFSDTFLDISQPLLKQALLLFFFFFYYIFKLFPIERNINHFLLFLYHFSKAKVRPHDFNGFLTFLQLETSNNRAAFLS